MTEAQRKSIQRLQDSGHYQRIGKMGGDITKRRMLAKDPDHYEKIGFKGGKSLLEKYGKKFFSDIGKLPSAAKREEQS